MGNSTHPVFEPVGYFKTIYTVLSRLLRVHQTLNWLCNFAPNYSLEWITCGALLFVSSRSLFPPLLPFLPVPPSCAACPFLHRFSRYATPPPRAFSHVIHSRARCLLLFFFFYFYGGPQLALGVRGGCGGCHHSPAKTSLR